MGLAVAGANYRELDTVVARGLLQRKIPHQTIGVDKSFKFHKSLFAKPILCAHVKEKWTLVENCKEWQRLG
jgi:hypothetical protein